MKKAISLITIVSLVVLSSSTPRRSNFDIICDGDFCFWQLNNSPNYFRLDNNGKILTYWENRSHKIYRENKSEHTIGGWSLHGDTLVTDYFSGRIAFIQDGKIVLENAGKYYILFQIYKHNRIYKLLNEARYQKKAGPARF